MVEFLEATDMTKCSRENDLCDIQLSTFHIHTVMAIDSYAFISKY